MNWGELKASFTALLDREDATTAQIEAWCRDGYARVGRVLRIPTMERTVELAVSGGALTIPADFVKLKALWVPGYEKLRKVTPGVILEARPLADNPQRYARIANKWHLWPQPANGAKVTCWYYGSLTPIVNDATLDPVLEIAAPLVVRAALVFAEDFFDGSRQGKWEAQFQSILSELHMQTEDVDIGGADAAAEPGYPDVEY